MTQGRLLRRAVAIAACLLAAAMVNGCSGDDLDVVAQQSPCETPESSQDELQSSPDMQERLQDAAGDTSYRVQGLNRFDFEGLSVMLVVAFADVGPFAVVGADHDDDGVYLAEQNLQGLAPPLYRSDEDQSVFGSHQFTPLPSRFIATTISDAREALLLVADEELMRVGLCNGVAIQQDFVTARWPNGDVSIQILDEDEVVLDVIEVQTLDPVD